MVNLILDRLPDVRDPEMRRVYVAGPVTGIPDLNFPAFNATAAELRALGFHVENPAENVPERESWLGYMRMSLVQIAHSDWMFMLPGWERSKGASIEHRLASDLGLRIVYAEGAAP
jgi:Domain of unknown function (DUF4406)